MESNLSDGALPDVTTAVQDIHTLPTLILNYGTMGISILIIVMETATVALIRKCRRIPNRISHMLISFLLSDLVGAIIYLAHQLAMFAFDTMNDLLYNSRTILVATMLSVSWASISAMSIERMLAVKMSLKYTTVMSDLRVLLILSFIWVFHIMFVILFGVGSFEMVCSSDLEECDITAACTPIRLALTFVLGFYEVLIIVCYGIIYKVASKHARRIDSVARENGGSINFLDSQLIKTTNAILKIVLAFWILHTPSIIHLIVFVHDESSRNNTLRRAFHGLSFICLQINSFVSVRLYFVTLKEVRMHLFYLLGKIFPRFTHKAEILRHDVFNIIAFSGNERRNPH